MQRSPKAVIISDIHFTPTSLELASSALEQAAQTAKKLGVPLILAGDTLDSKAIIRGECANRLIEILGSLRDKPYVLVGNHDLLNEKGREHSLNFLRPYAHIVEAPAQYDSLGFWLIPYMNDTAELEGWLKQIPTGATLIIHQGVQTAFMGHYVQDKTSLPKEAFADFRVISGHYHRAQDIKCGRPRKGAVGLFSYVGSPYTTSFSEANDGPKGFQVLFDDGILELQPTNLRKHIIIETDTKALDEAEPFEIPAKGDLIWLKVRGPYTELEALNKKALGAKLFGHSNFKLDKIYLEISQLEAKVEQMTDEQVMDAVIDRTEESPAEKESLKALWREILS